MADIKVVSRDAGQTVLLHDNGDGSYTPYTALTGGTTTKDVIVANGAAGLSAEVDLEGYTLAAIQMPATWVAANITFQAATASGGTFQDVYDDSDLEVTVVAVQGHCVTVDAAALKLGALRHIKLRSGTAAAPVNQTADRTLTLILKR